MNNRGWGLREELIICLVLITFFGIAIIFIHKVNDYLIDSKNENIMDKSSNYDNKKRDTKRNTTGTTAIIKKGEESTVKDDNDKYKKLENDLTEAAIIYNNKYYTDTIYNNNYVVTVVRLKTDDILSDFKINNTYCSGYVEIEKDSITKYSSYIKCGNLYETKGYDKNKDNLDL